ncbi:MAG TPA: DUF1080 domain-containing protein, partial [Terriglobales bacterium]|nr:DUF1080 domain-containing protein [Terriglobales bacterium]
MSVSTGSNRLKIHTQPGKEICGLRHVVAVFAVILFLVLNGVPQTSTKADWSSLFNGKDLAGWKVNGDEKWTVEQGTIVGESTAGKYGYLTTEKSYRDFDLRLKFKGEANGNSGVFLRSRITGVNPEHGPDIEGMQVEVDPNPGKHTGGLYESGGRGWVVMPTADGEKALKQGDWNELEVSAHGNHIT